MRNYQNAGTGSTVHSLGGLGIYNGTLINFPVWDVNGITNFGNVGPSYISIPTISLKSGGFSFLSNHYYVADNNRILDTNVGDGVTVGLWANYAGGGIYFDTKTSLNGLNRLTGNGGIIPNVFNFSECVATSVGSKFYRNSVLTRSDVVNLNNIVTMSSLKFGNSATYPTLKISFTALIDTKDLNKTTYNLYRSTIGTGLGLN
jgi:hypothetical protein